MSGDDLPGWVWAGWAVYTTLWVQWMVRSRRERGKR